LSFYNCAIQYIYTNNAVKFRSDGWWIATNQRKQSGLVPKTYLKVHFDSALINDDVGVKSDEPINEVQFDDKHISDQQQYDRRNTVGHF